MPAKPAWLVRIPEIVHELRALTVPVVDRSMCERLFCVRRRRAITLMQVFGACQSGRTLLLERMPLVHKLEAIQEGQEFESEQKRKRKLQHSLDELYRHRAAAKVRIPVLPPDVRKQLPELPAGVFIRGCELAIEYNSVEQLLQRLYELSQAAATDFEAFVAVLETPARPPSEVGYSRPSSPT